MITLLPTIRVGDKAEKKVKKEKEGNSMKEKGKKETGRSWRRERRVIRSSGKN
jgi:hypothetical protein